MTLWQREITNESTGFISLPQNGVDTGLNLIGTTAKKAPTVMGMVKTPPIKTAK